MHEDKLAKNPDDTNTNYDDLPPLVDDSIYDEKIPFTSMHKSKTTLFVNISATAQDWIPQLPPSVYNKGISHKRLHHRSTGKTNLLSKFFTDLNHSSENPETKGTPTLIQVSS